jgi:hypothetical protein
MIAAHKKRRYLGVVIVATVLLTATPSRANLIINVNGQMPDLNFSGSNADELVVLDAAVHFWTSGIGGNRVFQLNIQAQDFANAPFAGGRLDTFDGLHRPTSGTLFIDPNLSNNFPGSQLSFFWFVDPTPLDHSEFTPHGDFGPNHRHFTGGPGVGKPDERHIDLLTILMHEMGHTLGWSADPLDRPDYNPLFVALMEPQPAAFQDGTLVFLKFGSDLIPLAGDGLGPDSQNELSHLGSLGQIPGWQGTLMSRVFLFTDRFLPGDVDYRLFEVAYGDTNQVVPEPASCLVFAVGSIGALVVFCGRRKRRSSSADPVN